MHKAIATVLQSAETLPSPFYSFFLLSFLSVFVLLYWEDDEENPKRKK